MANDILGQIFQEMQPKIVDGVDPDSVAVVLFSKSVISAAEYNRLNYIPVPDRCQCLMAKLHMSSHPQTFIYLRLALLRDYSWLVDEVDKQLTSPTSWLQKLRLDHSTDGKVLLRTYKSMLMVMHISGGQLPTNAGVSETVRYRLMSQYLSDASCDPLTLKVVIALAVDPGSLCSIYLCTKVEVRRPSRSEDITRFRSQH